MRYNINPIKSKHSSFLSFGQYKTTFFISLILSILVFLPFMMIDRGLFLYVGDYNAQQIPFYVECHRAIREGNMAWSWNTDLGANFVGSYAYYTLGSPTFWLLTLFPTSAVPYLVAPMLSLKIALASVTAHLYIRRYTTSDIGAAFGGILYAFCGWSIYNIFFNQFHETFVVFPLLLFALDELVYKNTSSLFTLSVALCAMVNYYLFVQVVVFVVIYFFVRTLTKSWDITPKKFLKIILCSTLGTLMSAILLFPAISAVVQVPKVSNIINGWDAIAYNGSSYFQILFQTLFVPDCPASPIVLATKELDFSSYSFWLPVVGIVFVITYMLNHKKDWLTKLLLISGIFLLVPGLNSIFNTFNANLYMRWIFMPTLFCSLSTVKALESGLEFKKTYRVIAVIMIISTIILGLFPMKQADGSWSVGLFNKDTYVFNQAIFFVISVALSFLSMYLLHNLKSLYLLGQNNFLNKKFFKLLLISTCIMALLGSYSTIIIGRTYSNGVDFFDKSAINAQELSSLETKDGERIDTMLDNYNVSMFFNKPSVNGFISIAPKSIFEYYNYLGGSRAVNSNPKGDDYAARALLSVKYAICNPEGYVPFYNYHNLRVKQGYLDYFNPAFNKKGECLMPGYKYKEKLAGYYVYENEYCLPQGFTYDYFYNYSDVNTNKYEERSKLLLKGMLLSEEQCKKYVGYFDGNLFDKTQDKIDYSEEEFKNDCKKIIENNAITRNFAINNNGFSCNIQTNKARMLFFSVPYDSGWSAYIDGDLVEIEKVNAGFMAIPVEKGDKYIEFRYETPGLKCGAIVSVIGVLLFAIQLIYLPIVAKKQAQ